MRGCNGIVSLEGYLGVVDGMVSFHGESWHGMFLFVWGGFSLTASLVFASVLVTTLLFFGVLSVWVCSFLL